VTSQSVIDDSSRFLNAAASGSNWPSRRISDVGLSRRHWPSFTSENSLVAKRKRLRVSRIPQRSALIHKRPHEGKGRFELGRAVVEKVRRFTEWVMSRSGYRRLRVRITRLQTEGANSMKRRASLHPTNASGTRFAYSSAINARHGNASAAMVRYESSCGRD
jgi:hypothetical protein